MPTDTKLRERFIKKFCCYLDGQGEVIPVFAKQPERIIDFIQEEIQTAVREDRRRFIERVGRYRAIIGDSIYSRIVAPFLSTPKDE